MACSCPGYWYRKTCRHWRAYREAQALVAAQNAVNLAWDTAYKVHRCTFHQQDRRWR